MRRFARGLLAAALTTTCILAAAQSGFKAPIKIIVPQAPGGGTDLIARLVAPGLAKELGQNVIVENKPGASGQIGTQLVQNAPADGSTILCAVDHSLIVVPLTVPNVRYDVVKDFVALGQGARTYWTLIVPGNAPYKDFNQYVAALKSDPLARSYGVPLAGGAPTVVAEAIGRYAGVQMTEVPFQGSAPVMQNLMAGQIPAGLTGMPEAISVSRSTKAKVIAVSGAQRTALLPDVPTFKELGVDNLAFHTFVGFFAPKGLPPQLAQEFNAALRKSLADPVVLEKITAAGLVPAQTNLDEAAREVGEISRFWKGALKKQQ
jgi:tripartite-type tricarboxylate transporter receptor subunit TctC